MKDIRREPFSGIGKPEALKHNLTGFWSRRITNEHRLVYTVKEDSIYIYGTKTYQFRELIKSSLTDASWCKEKQAWKCKVFNNYDTYITSIFQGIPKDL